VIVPLLEAERSRRHFVNQEIRPGRLFGSGLSQRVGVERLGGRLVAVMGCDIVAVDKIGSIDVRPNFASSPRESVRRRNGCRGLRSKWFCADVFEQFALSSAHRCNIRHWPKRSTSPRSCPSPHAAPTPNPQLAKVAVYLVFVLVLPLVNARCPQRNLGGRTEYAMAEPPETSIKRLRVASTLIIEKEPA